LKPFDWFGCIALTFALHWHSKSDIPLAMEKLSREQSTMKTPYDVDHEKGDPIYQTTSGLVAGDVFDESYGTTQRGLKSRHAQMIALGGTIGTGLFVGSGQTLARGGPAFILGTFIFMAALIWMIVTGKLLRPLISLKYVC
jgi:amino acid transporter